MPYRDDDDLPQDELPPEAARHNPDIYELTQNDLAGVQRAERFCREFHRDFFAYAATMYQPISVELTDDEDEGLFI